MPFEEIDQPEILIQKSNEIKLARKKDIVYVCAGIILMFINILITVFLTDEKDLSEFNRNDWITFSIMGIIEIITVAVTFSLLKKQERKWN